MDLTDLNYLKYSDPELIVRECLQTDNPNEELTHCAMALIIFGKKELSDKLRAVAPKFGLEVGKVITETRY
jgi:hypothetical protein